MTTATSTTNEHEQQSAEHSKLPWTLGQNGDDCARNHAICSGTSVIAKVYGLGFPIGKGWSPRSEADARLIVTAINNHAALVEALEACVNLLQVATVAGDSLYASPVRQQAIATLARVRQR